MWMSRSAFTLSYDTMSYETFQTTLYQYNIHIIVRYDVVWNYSINTTFTLLYDTMSYEITVSIQHSHYCTIRCRMKLQYQYNIHIIVRYDVVWNYSINTTFTLLYDTMSYEITVSIQHSHYCTIRCRMKLQYQYNIHIIVRYDVVWNYSINTTFTLLYDTSYEMTFHKNAVSIQHSHYCMIRRMKWHFIKTLYQYNIHIIVRYNVWNDISYNISIQHSHYRTIRCRMKQHFIQRCINTTFTLFRAKKRFIRKPFTFRSVRTLNLQLVLKLGIAHFVHTIWMIDGWPLRSAPMVLLSPAQLYKRRMELMFTLGEKGNFTIRFCIVLFLYTTFTL